MDVVQVELTKLIPYEFNNRTHVQSQVDRIANSIAEFGFNQPIVLDENNIILVGHGRWMAAQKLGLGKVPVLVRRGLTEVQKKAYRILDNKLQDDSDWSLDNIELELGFLEDSGLDLKHWGLDELWSLFPEEEVEAHDDGGPGEEPTECYIKRGDIIQLGTHIFICGDATQDIEQVAKSDVALLITDPPYGVKYVGKTVDALTIQNDDLDDDELAELWGKTLDSCLTAMRDGSAIYVSAPSGPKHLIFANALHSRGCYRQQLIWAKDSMVLGHSDYHYKHEPIFYGWKPGTHYFTDNRTKTSLLEFKRPKASKEHPTMKPIELWAELIGNSTRLGDIVLDPFLGSGTTLIAAEQLGRACRGVEIEPKYCQVIIDRYKKHCQGVGKAFKCLVNGEALDE